MISLTPAAAEQVRVAAQDAGAENMALRIAARVNESGMLEFGMGFDDERDNDTAVDSYGVTLLVNAQSAPMLDDVTIDFDQSRFVFMKASAPRGGGCGSGGCGGGGCGSGGGCS